MSEFGKDKIAAPSSSRPDKNHLAGNMPLVFGELYKNRIFYSSRVFYVLCARELIISILYLKHSYNGGFASFFTK
jgi:hypothetical protein